MREIREYSPDILTSRALPIILVATIGRVPVVIHHIRRTTATMEKKEATKAHPTCVICRGSIYPDPVSGWKDGHNAWPLEDGRCCGECNNLVVAKRLSRYSPENYLFYLNLMMDKEDGQ